MSRCTRSRACVTTAPEHPAPDRCVQLTPADHARRGSWMQTASGAHFYPLDPRPDEIRIYDVAHGLAHVCRYGGHARRVYTVAEHCVLVSQHVKPEHARFGLLHDLAEAYIGDMIRPLKRTPEMAEFRRAEAAIERAAAIRFGLEWTDEIHAAVKLVDDRILFNEIRELMADPTMYFDRMSTELRPLELRRPTRARRALNWITGRSVESRPLARWSPARAKREFLRRFAELFPEHAEVTR